MLLSVFLPQTYLKKLNDSFQEILTSPILIPEIHPLDVLERVKAFSSYWQPIKDWLKIPTLRRKKMLSLMKLIWVLWRYKYYSGEHVRVQTWERPRITCRHVCQQRLHLGFFPVSCKEHRIDAVSCVCVCKVFTLASQIVIWKQKPWEKVAWLESLCHSGFPPPPQPGDLSVGQI